MRFKETMSMLDLKIKQEHTLSYKQKLVTCDSGSAVSQLGDLVQVNNLCFLISSWGPLGIF